MLSNEIEILRKDFEFDEQKLRKKYEEEIRQLEENLHKEIELEKTHIENCVEIEIGKLKETVEAKIEELNKNRYKSLEIDDDTVNSSEYKDAVKKNKALIEYEIEKDKEKFESERKERRARFDQQMKVLFKAYDSKRIEYLKKEIVPLVKSSGEIYVADESILESRHQLKITRNAIRSGQSWALYKARFHEKSVICRVTVLAKVPIEIRTNLKNSTKCYRFLSSKSSDYFVKLHELFATDQKVYVIMDEAISTNMFHIIYKTKPNINDLKKWYRQICEALTFMHNYAIAHLNLKLENVIFSENNNVKIVGLSRAFCYFSLDQERLLLAPKLSPALHNDHLPPECFEGEFDPQKADIWSFGCLIYEGQTKSNPRKKNNKEKGRSKEKMKTSLTKVTLDLKDFKNPSFDFAKINPLSLRNLLKTMLDVVPMARPMFNEIGSSEYFSSE